MIKIAVDAMGGDYGVQTTVKAAMMAVKEFSDIEIYLYGDEAAIRPLLLDSTRIKVVHTPKFMSMGEHDPVSYIRKNMDCSMAQALLATKNHECDAFVSCGPTQCVIVAAHLIVRKLKEMSRVALCPIIPSLNSKGKILLDVGANVELRPEHLKDLAICGSIVAKEVIGVKNPKVALLNIGVEEGKGREVDRETYQLLSQTKEINFVGNIEPKEMLFTDIDVFVSDGFTGNMVLKTLEGTAKVMGTMLKEEISSSLGGKIGYLFMRKNMNRFKKRMDTSEVGGAMVLGVPVPVIKSHGSSDPITFKNAIRQARTMVINKVVDKIVADLQKKDDVSNE